MASQTYATRRAALNTVLARLERDGTIGPEHELPEAFADTGDLLATAQLRWHSHLGARIDAALETGDEPTIAIGGAYRDTVRSMPEIRRLLDSHADHPVLAAAQENELSLLAWAAGLAPRHTPKQRAAQLGREFRDAVSVDIPPARPAANRDGGWLRRLKNVIPA